ncbi:MAG: NAD(P)-binding protein, partial [Chlorobi bacterium]|nr:NAD(P)-binding protein [Chlorobiota bacterium]
MTDTDVIIVGAGPAGSSCAGILKEQGVDFILLDKQT